MLDMKKRLLWICLLCMLCILLPLSATAAVIDSGECGAALRWELTDAGVLTISGTGKMTDYSNSYSDDYSYRYTDAPWFDEHSNHIVRVAVSSGVTGVGSSAFALLPNLVSVDLAASVSSIGEDAFSGCTALTAFTLPVRVTALANGIFNGCTSLRSVSLPPSLISIGSFAFYHCEALTALTIPENVRSIGTDAFSETGLRRITIPEGVDTLAIRLFCGCKSLTEVELPDGIKSIGGNAFGGCTALTNFTLPAGVTVIDSYGFRNCSALTSITLNDKLSEIGKEAFQNCPLTSIRFPEGLAWIGENAFGGCTKLSAIRFEGPAPTIAADAFSGVTAETAYPGTSPSWTAAHLKNYGGSLTWVPFSGSTAEAAIIRGDCGDGLTWTLSDGVLTISGMGFMDDYENSWYGSSTGAPWGHYIDAIHSVVVGNGVLSIGDYAFQRFTSLTSVSIPTSIINYGIGVFYGCESLTSFTIPYGVRHLPEDMFFSCTALSSVSLPQTIETIGDRAFSYCEGLRSIRLPENLKSIGKNAFAGTGLRTLTLPDSVTSLGLGCFHLCSDLTQVTLGKRLHTIPELCFQDTFALKTITIPATVRTIEPSAFELSYYYADETSEYTKAITFEGDIPAMASDAMLDNYITIRYPHTDEWRALAASGKTYGARTMAWEPYFPETSLDKCLITVKYTPVIYTGKSVFPERVTVSYGGILLTEGTHYRLSYADNVNAGQASVTVTGLDSFKGTVTRSYEILKQYPTLTFKAPTMTVKSNAEPFTNPLTAVTDGKLTYAIVNDSIAAIDSATGKITVKGVGSTYVDVKASEGTNYREGSARFTLTVEEAYIANPLTRQEMAYSFSHTASSFGYPKGYKLPLSAYTAIMAETEARKYYEQQKPWGGSCYGMSISSGSLLVPGSGLSPSQFGKSKISQLHPSNYSASLGLSFKQVVEIMHASWATRDKTREYYNNLNDLAGLIAEVERSRYTREPVCVFPYARSDYGHAILAYDIKYINKNLLHICIYDVNYKTQERYIPVTIDSNGNYTSWFYSINDRDNCGSSYPTSFFSYHRYSVYSAAWRNRNTRSQIANDSSLFINVDNFEIRSREGSLLAYMKDGQFTSYVSSIYLFHAYDPNLSLRSHLVYLPTDAYRIINLEGGTLEATMVNRHQSAEVITSAREVLLDVSDLYQTNRVHILGAAGDSYSVELTSSLDCAEAMKELTFSGIIHEDAEVELGTISGELYVARCDELSIWCSGLPLGSTLTGEQQDISAFTITPDYTVCGFNGEARQPAITVTNGAYQLQEHKDFIVIYTNDTQIGTATAVIYGIGAYGGVAYRDYEIVEITPEACAQGHHWNLGVTHPDADDPTRTCRTFTCMVCGETRVETIPGCHFQLVSVTDAEAVLTLTNTMPSRITGTVCIMAFDSSGKQIATAVRQINLGGGEQVTLTLPTPGKPARIQAIAIDNLSLSPLYDLWTCSVPD